MPVREASGSLGRFALPRELPKGQKLGLSEVKQRLSTAWRETVLPENLDARVNERSTRQIIVSLERAQRDGVITQTVKKELMKNALYSLGNSLNGFNNHEHQAEAATEIIKAAKFAFKHDPKPEAALEAASIKLHAITALEKAARVNQFEKTPITRFLAQNIKTMTPDERGAAFRAIAHEVRRAGKPEIAVELIKKHAIEPKTGGVTADFTPLNWIEHNEKSAVKAFEFLADVLNNTRGNDSFVRNNAAEALTIMTNRDSRDALENRTLPNDHPLSVFNRMVDYTPAENRTMLISANPEATATVLREIARAKSKERASRNWSERYAELRKEIGHNR